MTLAFRPFGETFDFARPIAAGYRGPDGLLTQAAIDVARFDHDVAGTPLGLLVEQGGRLGEGDRLTVESNDDWHEFDAMTVLSALRIGDAIERGAVYTRAPVATVNGLLAGGGRHVSIGAFPGFLPNRDGFVLYGGARWRLAGLIGDGLGAALADDAERPLLDG